MEMARQRRRPLDIDRPPLPDRVPDGPGGGDEIFRGATPGQERPKPATIDLLSAADFAGKPIVKRRWIVPDLIPAGDITLLSGDGGTGKSLLSLQLCVAVATGGEWIGEMPEPGSAIFLTAEDDFDEVHRRLAAIHPALADLRSLQIISLAGKDALLAVSDKSGHLSPTPLYAAVEQAIRDHRPSLLVLDTLADLYGGDEIKRAEARAFIGLLRRFCIEFGITIVLLSHPSLQGLSSGSGTSGSTAWSNSVRSRLYFERVKAKGEQDGEEADPNLRILSTKKANYGPSGRQIAVRWRKGTFVLDGAGVDHSAAAAKADRAFLEMLAQFEREGRPVSHLSGTRYAPAAFANHYQGKSLTKRQYRSAMDRLLSAGKIKCVEEGPPSKRRAKLIEATP